MDSVQNQILLVYIWMSIHILKYLPASNLCLPIDGTPALIALMVLSAFRTSVKF